VLAASIGKSLPPVVMSQMLEALEWAPRLSFADLTRQRLFITPRGRYHDYARCAVHVVTGAQAINVTRGAHGSEAQPLARGCGTVQLVNDYEVDCRCAVEEPQSSHLQDAGP